MALSRFGLPGDTFGGHGDIFGDVAVVPSPDDTPLATEGILGCSNECAVYIADRSGQSTIVELPFTSVEWERVLSDTATATAEVSGLAGEEMSECCEILEDVDAWANELHVYRNRERVFEGPITGMELASTGITIRAADVSAWLRRRRIHENHRHTDKDLALIFEAYVSDAMSVDSVPGISVKGGPSGTTATRRVKANERKNARAEIDELARTSLTWTVIGRSIVLVPGSATIALRDDHIRSDADVVVDGAMASEVTVMGATRTSGAPQIVGVHATTDADALERYGVHEVVVTEDTIRDANSANRNAQRRQGRHATPAALFSGGELTEDFPMTIDQIVPGTWVDARLTRQCRGVNGRYRLTKVTGKFDAESDSISIDVQPRGASDL